MMHREDDDWYVARHPLHRAGDVKTFVGADNPGVGPGLAFAESLLARDPKTHIGDSVHFDAAAQSEIGKRCAETCLQLTKSP